MAMDYGFIKRLQDVIDIPSDGILTRPAYEDDDVRAVMFGFSAGQELSEHTAAKPAMLYFLKGRARIMLGADRHTATEGTWIHMPPNLPHSITAETAVTMLLVLMKCHSS